MFPTKSTKGKSLLRMLARLSFFLVGMFLMAATLNLTWFDTNWNTTWTQVNDSACDTSTLRDYQTTGGNPDHRRRSHCEGKADISTGHHEWAGTWETLGVTAGNTVSAIQMTDVDYQYTTDTSCDDVDIGPFELRNSSNTLVSTMWAGTGSLTTAGAYAAAGSQTAVGVGALGASTSSIELWMQTILDTANVTAAICTSSFDNLDVTVTHSLATRSRNIIAWLLTVPPPRTYQTRVTFASSKKLSGVRNTELIAIIDRRTP